ncbi:MAG: protein kinase, partial [Gammaproteobacteria bacterium]|nr:protein kinase [Gammaproteobacteria bacterium]
MEEKQTSYTPPSSAEEARAQSHNNSPGRLTYIDTSDAASNTDALFRAVGRPDSVAFRKLLETTSAEDIVIKRNNRLLTGYLWMAASWPLAEKRELLQMLKERGAIWSSPVFEALCLSDNPSTIQSTYANHAAGQVPLRDSEGRTLLHYAAVEDLLPITHWLISEGVVRAGDGDHMGVTPLLLAAGKGHLATVQYLLSPEGGASIKEQDNNRVRWLLLEGGASVDERNRHGSLAYNLTRSPEIKSFLEAFKRCGKDPLNYVITYHAVDVLQRIVVQRKAQKSLTIEERNNLLKISVEQEFPDITRLILEEFTSSEELPLLRDLTSLSENIPLSRALTLCQQMSLRRIQELGKQQYDDAAREARNRSDSGAATSYPLEEKAMNDNLFMLTEAAVPEEVRQQLADFLRANFSLQNAQSEVMRQLYSAIKAPMELVDLDTITAEYNLNIAKPPQGVQQPKEAEAKEVITPHAQKEMIAVRELIGQCIKTHLSAYPELCEALQRLDAYYHDYQTSLAEACSAGTLHDQIFKQYSLLGLGKPRYLTPAAKSCLALPLEKLKRDNNDFGMHTVIRAGDLYFKLSPEGNDCVPGMEFAVTAFYDVVAGVGTAPTRLLRVKGPECSHIYVASKAVLGPNLRHTLQYDWEAFYKQLDSFNFSVQVIVSLLTRPADAKADNFLVIPRTNSQRIIGVDNDLAFASPIVPGPAEHDPGHYPELLCVFFFFPQMQHPIDQKVRDHLLNTHPAMLIMDWLFKLDEQNKRYQS